MENFLDSAKEKFNEMTESVSSLLKTDVLDSMKNYGIEKINDAWQEM